MAAVGLAMALTCEEKPFVGCGTCASCERVARRNHPDVTWVVPDAEQLKRGWAGRSDFDRTPSRDIRVEQIRQLQERLALRALEAPHKVVIVTPAHAMNGQAQNALLKTLEEPPRDTVMVLVSSQPDRLLPTVRSRCAKTLFAPLPLGFIAEMVKQKTRVDEETAQSLASLAGGSLERALSLNPKALARRLEVTQAFDALRPEDARGWLRWAEKFGAERADAEEALDVLSDHLHDAAVKQPSIEVHRRMLLLEEAGNAIRARNGAARLQLERMLIEMFGASR